MNYNDATFYSGNEPRGQYDSKQYPVVEGTNLDNYPSNVERKSDNLGLKIAAAVGGAAALGTGAVLAYNHFGNNDDDNGTGEAIGNLTAETGNGIPEAHSVNDNMTYQEAFEAARAEVGPGGCFVWHGGVYGTYTQTEWNAMSPAEQAEFTHNAMGEHAPGGYVAQNQTTVNNTTHVYTEEHRPAPGTGSRNLGDNAHREPAARHSHPGNGTEGDTTHNSGQNGYRAQNANNNTGGSSHNGGDEEVHFLSVSQEDYDGRMVTVGRATIGGRPAILVDSDNDGVFDYMAYDSDGSGDLSESEVQQLPQNSEDCIRVSEFEQACLDERGGEQTNPGAGDTTDPLDENGVHLIGVAEDVDENGNPISVGYLTMDGHEGVVIDVDHDGYFDVMAVDADDNGEISDREVMTLNEPIAVQDFSDVEIYGEGGDADAIDGTYDSDNASAGNDDFFAVEPDSYEEPEPGAIEVDVDSDDALSTGDLVYDDQGNIVGKDEDVQVDPVEPDYDSAQVEVVHDENVDVDDTIEVEPEHADTYTAETVDVAYEEPTAVDNTYVEPATYNEPESYDAAAEGFTEI